MKMKNITRFTALVFVAVLSACNSKNKEGQVTLVSASKIANSGAPASEKSEEYAKAAELLMTAEGFSQAHQLSERALQQDSKNVRARFVHALSSLMMVQKGIFARIRPLAEKSPSTLSKYNQYLAEMNMKKMDSKKNIESFYLDGQPDIRTEAQLQKHIDLTAKSFEDFRQFLRNNKDSELTIKANTALVPDLIERYTESCEIHETAQLEYELTCAPHEERFNVTLNRADFELIASSATMQRMYFLSLNAYDLTGGLEVVAKYPRESDASEEVVVGELEKKPSFGSLRNEARLFEIKNLGIDAVSGLNWAAKNQNTLCLTGELSSKNRIGKYLNKGFCLGSNPQPWLDMLVKVFSGEAIESKSEKNNVSYVAKAAYGAFFLKPPQDLRSLGPFQFDECRNLVQVGDPTLAGVFPEGDANKVLPLTAFSCGGR